MSSSRTRSPAPRPPSALRAKAKLFGDVLVQVVGADMYDASCFTLDLTTEPHGEKSKHELGVIGKRMLRGGAIEYHSGGLRFYQPLDKSSSWDVRLHAALRFRGVEVCQLSMPPK